MPSWVNEGINEYVKRMPAHIKLVFKEIEADKRGGRDSEERSMQRRGVTSLQPFLKKVWSLHLMNMARNIHLWSLQKR